MNATTHRFRTNDGVEIVYYVTPGEADKPPLIVLHGFSGDASRDFLANGVASALGADGRTIVAPDQRGHGASGAPGPDGQHGNVRMATDVGQLIEELGAPEVDLYGFSMGAAVALVAAIRRDNRIRRLVTAGAGYLAGKGPDWSKAPPAVVGDALSGEGFDAAAYPYIKSFVDSLADRTVNLPGLVGYVRSAQFGPIALERISVPTLVVGADADPFAENAATLAAGVPGARLEIIEGDHGAYGPGAFAELVLEFLGRPV